MPGMEGYHTPQTGREECSGNEAPGMERYKIYPGPGSPAQHSTSAVLVFPAVLLFPAGSGKLPQLGSVLLKTAGVPSGKMLQVSSVGVWIIILKDIILNAIFSDVEIWKNHSP